MPALAITGALILVAGAVAFGFGLESADRRAVFFELPCRNLAIAALIGMSVLNRPELVYMATAFFLIEAVLLLGVVGILAAGSSRR